MCDCVKRKCILVAINEKYILRCRAVVDSALRRYAKQSLRLFVERHICATSFRQVSRGTTNLVPLTAENIDRFANTSQSVRKYKAVENKAVAPGVCCRSCYELAAACDAELHVGVSMLCHTKRKNSCQCATKSDPARICLKNASFYCEHEISNKPYSFSETTGRIPMLCIFKLF